MHHICLLSDQPRLHEKILASSRLEKNFIQVSRLSHIQEWTEIVQNTQHKSWTYLVLDAEMEKLSAPYVSPEDQVFVIYRDISDSQMTQMIQEEILFKNRISLKDFSLEKLIQAGKNHRLNQEREQQQRTIHHLLIVDDVISNLILLENFLQHTHWKVFKADNALAALKILFEQEIHLLILDVQLPGIHGYDLAKYVKGNVFTQSIPIIFLTAFNKNPEQVVRGIEHGAVDYMYKPVDRNVLRTKVHALLQLFDYQTMLKYKNEQLEDQKKWIQEKNRLLLENIDYAAKVQRSILPSNQIEDIPFTSFSVWNQPKDMVSGDFYFIKKHENQVICALFDCTGHGVSGALMSTAVNAIFQNCIEQISGKISPSALLQKFYQDLILKMGSDQQILSDSADVAVCVIEPENRRMLFSGFNIPVWKYSVSDVFNVSRITSSRGLYYDSSQLISDKSIDFKEGDLFILFTDGLSDQLGGAQYEKLKSTFLERALMEHKPNSATEVTEVISSFVMDWKADQEQTDDMCLLCFSF